MLTPSQQKMNTLLLFIAIGSVIAHPHEHHDDEFDEDDAAANLLVVLILFGLMMFFIFACISYDTPPLNHPIIRKTTEYDDNGKVKAEHAFYV